MQIPPKTSIILLIALGVCVSLSASGFTKLEAAKRGLPSPDDQTAEVLYLPNGRALQLISFGYRNVLSNVLWFNSISYFGKHFRTDQNYEWLFHMADLVTTLDPHSIFVYEFISTMLSWEANKPDQAVALLTKAIEDHPGNWRLYYLRGFTFMYFLHESENAARDFRTASQQPMAPVFAARLASKVLVMQNSPETAIEFLKGALATVKDETARAALEERLREAFLEVDLRRLAQAVEIYRRQYNHEPDDINELVASGIVSTLPPDPFGGKYYIEPDSGEVRSTSNRKRLSESLNIPKERDEQIQ